MGWDGVVGIATFYGLDGPAIKSRWEQDVLHLCSPVLGATQTPVTMATGSLSREYGSQDVTLTTCPI